MLGIERIHRNEIEDYSLAPFKRGFSPYQDNGGTTISIAGPDYAVIASDTRLTSGDGYDILTRHQSKLFQLSDTTVLGSTGCWCDVLTFVRVAEARLKFYKNTHNKEMTSPAVAQMMSTMLYNKRFFPYYIYNNLAGLDENGRGVVYHYDPVGHCELSKVNCSGASDTLIQPLLDNQFHKRNMQNVDKDKEMSLDEALNLIHDCFVSAAEREINTGDGIVFKIITKSGVEEKHIALRKD